MSRPLIVLADDLTGAAEVAAIAHERGLRAVVVTKLPTEPIEADVIVFDTDTRLAKAPAAARRLREAARQLAKFPNAGFFKKADSVLRGPVLSELLGCMQGLDRTRAVLVAGNPSLGRVTRNGQFSIDGRPLNQTPFAQDPHHPAHTADVLALLRPTKHMSVAYLPPVGPLPKSGVIIGEHRSAADTTRWVGLLDEATLPAGAADFFKAWLAALTTKRPAPAPATLEEPALLLHGTTTPPANTRLIGFNGLRAPSAVRVATALRLRGGAAVAATTLTASDPFAPSIISLNFARLASDLRDARAFRHLLIAGGATAASVLRALGWTHLEVVRVWAPGVVTLRPESAPTLTVTLKPGSYLWPTSLRRTLPAVFT
jgi:uncharacterized protein YgbK (DUF1537 family)